MSRALSGWKFGADAQSLVYRVNGRVGELLVYRGEVSGFDLQQSGRAYAFDTDGGLLRLASEAYRLRLPHLFARTSRMTTNLLVLICRICNVFQYVVGI